MKVKILNRYKVKSGLLDKNKEVMEDMYELNYQMIVWSRTVPFREGLNDLAKWYYHALHKIVKTKNALASISTLNEDKDFYIIELDLLKDGRVFDVYDITLEEDGFIYADVVEIKEITHEEFEENDVRRKNMQKMLEVMQLY